jgi:N-acetylneuraminic acid mutarotase
MINARHSHTMILFEATNSHLKTAKKLASLFVIGGIGADHEYINSIERFNIEKNSWELFQIRNAVEMNIVGPFSCQINDEEILIFGGCKYYINNETVFGGNAMEVVSEFVISSLIKASRSPL